MYKVGVIGPESTGKSTLSKYLANRYAGLWVPEYAREYMESLAPMYAYTHEDVLRIAEFQVLQMRELCEHHRLLLSKGYRRDTEGISKGCADCHLCLDACPTGALRHHVWDARKCIAYTTHYCLECQIICPYNNCKL